MVGGFEGDVILIMGGYDGKEVHAYTMGRAFKDFVFVCLHN